MLTVATPPLRPYTRLLSRLGWSLLLFFAMFTVSTSVVEVVFEGLPSTTLVRALYGLFSAIAYTLPFILSGIIFRALSRRGAGKYDSLLPRRPKDQILLPAFFPLLVLAGLSVNLIAAEINYYFCFAVGYSTPGLYEPVYYDTPAAFILYMSSAIAPAFAEEYLFRGVVYENLRPFGKWQAVIISAMTFALMHQNISQLFYTFACGIVLALMYEWTGSIWCGVFFHLFNNELAVLTESLVYGAYGERSYDAILVWNAAIVCIGIASIMILRSHAKAQKRRRAEALRTDPGIWGVCARESEAWDAPMDARHVRRALRSPGMLAYIIYTVGTVLLDYLVVISMNAMVE